MLNGVPVDAAIRRLPYLPGRNLMPDRPWQVMALVLCLLTGCNANYVFDDADYRPLGDPQATRRGQ
jgi:hypothetical protein